MNKKKIKKVLLGYWDYSSIDIRLIGVIKAIKKCYELTEDKNKFVNKLRDVLIKGVLKDDLWSSDTIQFFICVWDIYPIVIGKIYKK